MGVSGERPDGRRVIAVASGVDHLRADELERQLPSACQRGVRAAFLVGEEDGALESVKPFHEKLVAAGIASRLDVVPGVGHDYPPDLESRLPDIFAWFDVP